MKLTKDLEKNKKVILDALKNNPDILTRELTAPGGKRAAVVYLDGMCKTDNISAYVLRPLTLPYTKPPKDANYIDDLLENVLLECHAETKSDIEEIYTAVMMGDACLIVDGQDKVVMLDTKGYTVRSISEPPTNGSLKGPREGFIEDFKQNLLMIRRKIKTPALVSELLSAGKQTKTNIAVVYISDIADPNVVKKVKEKISQINIDGILDSSYVAAYLEEKRGSVFPQVGRSEKPDAIAGKLLEGRVAIIVDGSPLVLTVPYMLIEELFGLDDYYEKPALASIGRVLRLLSLAFALLLPGIYVCIQKYNYQIIPTKFLMTIMNATDNLPLSPLAEMLVVIFLFDMLQEANVRMPRTAGLALNVLGALVLGDAAIKAGLISAPAVLIGALNGIGLYSAPQELRLFSMLRWIFTLAAGLFGVPGMSMAIIFFVSYLTGLDSYGTPYLAPYAPRIKNDLQDGFIKQSFFKQIKRPEAVPNINKTRISEVK